MPRWFERFQRGRPSPRRVPQPMRLAQAQTLELVALEGADAGGQFTLDGDEISVGRGAARTGQIGAICLSDPTVSPSQAIIRIHEDGVELIHRQGTTNPTLLNGQPVERARIRAGDRIQMGRVVFEVRERAGMTLSGLVRIPEQLAATRLQSAIPRDVTTEVRLIGKPFAHLHLVSGIDGWEGKAFDLATPRAAIGRSPESDFVIPENGVSRSHAEFHWERGVVTLVHKSTTNATYVNGIAVAEQQALEAGDLIQLADRVVMRFEFAEEEAEEQGVVTPRSDGSLRARMEEKIQRDAEIEREFGFRGSFLDIDVVDSHGLKVRAQRPEHIVVSFERFRNFASRVVEEFGGQVLNSNGDELMCYFEEPLEAVRAASTLLTRLEVFNGEENLLGSPFRVRQGIHTGESLVDRERGYAYSPVLDTAGHLQKYAPENGVLVSADTVSALPSELPFEAAGEVGKEAVPSYRLAGELP